jgi:hypothetical protein
MEKKQTAVEQLINEMESLLEQPYVNPKNALNDCINLAYNKLQMEKEQIIKSYLDGDSNGCGCYDWSTEEQAEDYYKETYKEIK